MLVVDDHPAARTGICEILKAEGFATIDCGSAEEALSILQRKPREPVSMVLLDLHLPDVGGIRLLERVRDLNPKRPVIVYTGEGSYESARQALNLGAAAYLEKGDAPEHLVATVKRHLKAAARAQKGRATAADRESVVANLPLGLQLLQSVRESVIATDLEGRIVYWSKGATALYGYTPTEVLGKQVTLLVQPHEAPEEEERMRRVCETGFWKGEYLQQRKDGRSFWSDTFISLLNDRHGRPCGYIGIDRDISERKQAEEDARARQARLHRIADSLPGAVYRYLLHPSGEQRFLYMSRGIEELLGLTAEESQRDFSRVWSLGHPDDAESLLQSIQESARTLKPWCHEFRVIIGGRIKWLRGSSIPEPPHPDGSLVWNGILVDITEQKLAENALRFARFATDRAADCIYWMTPDAKFFYVNDAACQSLGYSRDELLSMSFHDIDPDYPAAAWPAFWEQLRAQQSVTLESRLRRSSGEVFPVEIKANYLEFECKEFNCSIVRDFTQRKRAEAALREAQVRLLRQQEGEKRRIEEELDKARATLVRQTRLAALGQLLGSMAHELRNPLAMIRNASYLLRRRVSPTDESAAEYLNMIECEVDLSNRVIQDLQALSRGKTPHKQMVDLGRQIQEAKPRAGVPPGVTCRVVVQPDPFQVFADPGLLQQVLVNLMSNACQAMHHRGGLTVRARRARGWDVLTISDTGPGIPEDRRRDIFEPLFTTKLHGFGLGLTICRHIVDQHGGSIELLDSPRGGAVFEIRLPHRTASS